MNKIRIIFLVAVSLVFTRCDHDDCHKSILFSNMSSQDIYVIFNANYPDTLSFIHGPSPIENENLRKVSAHTVSRGPLHRRSCWENIFTSEEIPSDTLMIYVFDATVIETVPWAIVTNEKRILKRYDVSLKDLERLQWTISYP